MDTRGVWEIILTLLGLLGSAAFNLWYVGYKVGKSQAALVRMEKEQDRQLNQNLRIFQAIEELRRRVGNGDRDWLSLTGG